MTAVKEIPHGTRSGYTRHKCRCDVCWEAQSEYMKAYYAANRDRKLAQGKARYEANRDRIRTQHKAYYEANRETLLAKQRERNKAHYEANRETRIAKQQEWRKRNPKLVRAAHSRRRARKLAAPSAPYTAQQIEQRWAMWGNRCWLNPSHPAEETDHVKPIAAGGADMLANFRPICRSCNASKGAKWPLDLSSTALQRDTAAAVSTTNPTKGK